MVLNTFTDGNIDASYVSVAPNTAIQPEITACFNYWQTLSADEQLPCWENFDWMKLPAEIIPHCGVVDISTEPLDFIYRFWGTAHAAATKQELTGKSVRNMLPAPEGQSVFRQYEETFNAAKPQMFVNTIRWKFEMREMKEYSLRLPFSEDGTVVTQILAVSDMRQDLQYLTAAFDKTVNPF